MIGFLLTLVVAEFLLCCKLAFDLRATERSLHKVVRAVQDDEERRQSEKPRRRPAPDQQPTDKLPSSEDVKKAVAAKLEKPARNTD